MKVMKYIVACAALGMAGGAMAQSSGATCQPGDYTPKHDCADKAANLVTVKPVRPAAAQARVNRLMAAAYTSAESIDAPRVAPWCDECPDDETAS